MGSLHVLPHRTGIERSRHPKGPRERSATVSEVDADQIGVHGGSSAWQTSGAVDGENTVGHDDTQQGGLAVPDPATHAGAHRAREVGRLRVYRARPLRPTVTTRAHQTEPLRCR